MSSSAMVVKEAQRRLEHGNFSVLTGALFLLCSVFLAVYFASVLISFLISEAAPAFYEKFEIIIDLSLITVFGILFFIPPVFSFVRMLYISSCGGSLGLDDMLYCMSGRRVLGSIRVSLCILWRKAVVLICLSTVYGLFSYLLSSIADNSFFAFSKAVLAIMLVCVYVWYSLRYILAPFLAVRDDFSISGGDTVTLSNNIMRSNRLKMLAVLARNIHLFLLSILVIPTAYTVPRIGMSIAVCAKWLIYNGIEESAETPNFYYSDVQTAPEETI